MDIKPIKTEIDYDAALAEIEALWGAETDTPEGDKLDVLITLVEAYEAKQHPIAPPIRSKQFYSEWSKAAWSAKIWNREYRQNKRPFLWNNKVLKDH